MSQLPTRVLALAAWVLLGSASGHAQQTGGHHHMPEETTAPDDNVSSDESEREHVPPDPPAGGMADMPNEPMFKMAEMGDTAFGKILLDQFEWRDTNDENAVSWDATGYYGTDYNKIWLRTEGERAGGQTHDARAEVLWDRIISRWWSSQLGLRHDFGPGPARDWAAVGIQGLAPCFFDVEATFYVGDAGRTAARLKTEYEWLFTQRLILQPEAELSVYGKDDPEKRVMSGLSDVQVGFRLRYEIRRELAPYLGIAWVRRLGKTADLVRASGDDSSDLEAVAGVRVWF